MFLAFNFYLNLSLIIIAIIAQNKTNREIKVYKFVGGEL